MKKLLLTLLLLFTLGLAAHAETWSYTVTKGAYTNHDFSNVTVGTKSDISFGTGTEKQTWQMLIEAIDSSNNPNISNDGTSPAGILIGAAAHPAKSITLYSGENYSDKTITKVTVKVNGGANSNCSYNATAKVGTFTNTKTDAITGNASAVDLEWTPNTTGEIEIIFTNNTTAVGKGKNAGLKICSITVEYSDAVGPKEFTFDGFTDRTVDFDDMVELNLPADAPTISYSSTNEEVAYVEENVIYAVGIGSADITATWGESEAWKAGNKTFKVTVENPNLKDAELSFDKTAYDAEVGVEFSAAQLTNPYNLAVVYSSENPEIATVDAATGVVTPLAAGTVKITAKSEPTDEYKAGEASYTLNVVKVNRANSLAEFIAMGKELGDKAEIVINFDMTVTYANAFNTYVTDGENFGLIFKNGASENLAEAGQVLKAGWVGKLTVYQTVLPEIIPVSDPTIDGTAEFTPKTYTLAEITDEMVNEVVLIKGVEFATATPGSDATGAALNFTGTQNGTEGAFYNKFKIESEDAGTYDVIGVVNLFKLNDNTDMVRQIYPIEYMLPDPVLDGEPEIIVKHGTSAGVLTVKYTFNVANFVAEKHKVNVVITAEGHTLEFKEVVPEASAAPARANAQSTVFTKEMKATHESLKGATTPNVTVRATLNDGTELFNNTIEAKDITTTGIEDVVVEGEGEAEYFNLQGLRVAQPEAGQLYIKRQGGKAVKVRF